MLMVVGTASMLAKIDVKHAFRLCPVRKADWPLLCYFWLGAYFVDTRLPFGSRSSPAIFNNFADLLAWVLIHIGEIKNLVHYLDDFFICAPDTITCSSWMHRFTSLFRSLGVPIASDKTVGPSSTITYLGIEIDAVAHCIRLPQEKYNSLLLLLQSWNSRKKCTKRELLSLIGSLSFAAKVVKPGRLFLRRLIDLSTTVKKLSHHIYLDTNARADISWWLEFFPSWNGISLFQDPVVSSFSINLFTDASDLGLGGVFGSKWFSCQWPDSFVQFHINFKEIFAIFAAVAAWAHFLANKQIIFHCDNLAIVSVWQSGSCKNPDIMRVMRALFFTCAVHNINLLTTHIPGSSNIAADLLSRLQVPKFRFEKPDSDPEPTPLPDSIWQI